MFLKMLRIVQIFSRTCTKNFKKYNWLVPLKAIKYRSNHCCTRITIFYGTYTIYPIQIRCLTTTFGPVTSCWKCKYSYPVHSHGETTFFCPSCKVVQQPQDKRTYFDIMDCEQKFELDAKALTNNFRKLQSQLHPDKFTLKSEAEQKYSSLQSSIVNEAYQTLLKPLSRGIYLLKIEGLPIEDGNTAIDVEFLTDIMEMNETLESGTKSELNKLKSLNKDHLEWCINEVSKAFRKNDLMTAKEVLSKMKYYDNINEQINEQINEKLME